MSNAHREKPKRIAKKLITVMSWFLLFHLVNAQSEYLLFDRLTIEDGLPNSSVMDIMQDDQGFIWIGTFSGIARYDGYELKIYRPAAGDPDKIPVRDIPRLYQDKSGGIWVGLVFQDAKLFKYHPEVDKFVPYLYDPERNFRPLHSDITAMQEDREGHLLVATDGQGLLAIDIQQEKNGIAPADLPFQVFRAINGHPDSLASDYLGRSIVEDEVGNYWIPTGEGLCKFSPEEGRFETFRYSADTSDWANACYTLLLDEYPTLWVGTLGQGLLQFDRRDKTFTHQFRKEIFNSDSDRNANVFDIARARSGELWLFTNQIKSTIRVFNPNTRTQRFRELRSRSEPEDDQPFWIPRILTTDQNNNLWCGSWQRGVFRYHPDRGAFHFLQAADIGIKDMEELIVSDLYEDREGIIWIGTWNQGLLRWDRKKNTFHNFAYQPGVSGSLPDNRVIKIQEGKGGKYLWVLTEGGTLNRMDPKREKFTSFSFNADWNTLTASQFPETDDHQIWLSNWSEGLYQLVDEESGRVAPSTHPITRKGKNLHSMLKMVKDEQGGVWLGLNQFGMNYFDPKSDSAAYFDMEYGVHDINFDQDGMMWLITHSAGLKGFDRQKKKVIHLDEEVNQAIGQPEIFVQDRRGFLWIYSSYGIIQFDPKKREVVRRFSPGNWIPKGRRWHYESPADLVTRSGHILFGNNRGLLYFHPDSLQIDTTPPRIAFTKFQIFNKVITTGSDSPLAVDITRTQEIRLKYFQNDFTLTFAALHFKAPEENQYRYKLDGYKGEWQEAGTQRQARYTNIPPGTYTFRVQAANSDGHWTDETQEARLILRISPPWYANVWAYTIYFLLFLAFLYGLYRFLLNRQAVRAETFRLQQLNQFKARFYGNITHEFRTPLTLILGVAEDLTEQVAQHLQKSRELILRQGNHLLRLVNQLLDLSKLESDSLPLQLMQADIIPFIRGVVSSFLSAAEQREISLVLQIKAESLTLDFDPEKVETVLGNLLSNALKFTQAGGEIVVKVQRDTQSQETLLIQVKDNGQGIPKAALPYIFDRYYRVKSLPEQDKMMTGGTTTEGVGIGLALVKELVQLMDSRIEVESEEEKGTVFQWWLPIERNAPAGKPALDPKVPKDQKNPDEEALMAPPFTAFNTAGQPLVLVVEDNEDMAHFLSEILEEHYNVRVAPDGAVGIQQALEWMPDLIVSDVMMPKVDGFELCRTLKQDERTSHIPIVLLTAKVTHEDRIEGLEQGADAYLDKPFVRRELLVRLEQLIEQRRKMQERFSQMPLETRANQIGYVQEAAFIEKVQSIIQTHLDDPDFSVPQLCLELGKSRTQVHEKLKALTGRSASRYIRALRLHHARQLLLNTSLSVTQIAFRVGFNDSNFFSTCFKEEFGLTPSHLRKGKA
ncbi:MAG: hybrid sensor histidine kinase/response regulator [Saprospiraceae bacterium]|nr:MAG: hybrid sensor histidine kinase/response regulator [Saprospiraceae bacterium]